MKLGFVSDSLGAMPFEELLDTAVRLGVSGIEVATGGWSTAPHFDLAVMKQSPAARRAFLEAFEARGLEVIALNANGNPVHPTQPEQGACLKDTIRVAGEALGEAVYHVHAKDTLLNPPVQATTSLLENGSLMDIPARSWSYITLGFRHGEEWWRQFCYRLTMAGYDGWLSIEHEDVLLNSLEGLEKSVVLLQSVMPTAPSDFEPQAI